jgi:hypothetical protein
MSPNAAESTAGNEGLKNLLLNQQWQSIANHIRLNPDDAKHPLEFNGVKALPLHVVCAVGAPIGVIKSLIAAYSAATQIKNDSGRLPLHCLFLHRCPSLNVLSAIIEVYPAASHIADSMGKLPIHYACEQTNVTDDSFTILLSTYPEGAYARDHSGRFPINYATSNTDSITKKCALAALDRGTLFASISKMTSNRIKDEQQVKIGALEESYAKKLSAMEARANTEREKLKSEIDGLKSQLQEVTETNQTLTQELNAAALERKDAVNMAIETEQAKASELEKKLRMELADVQLKNMDLVDQLETVQLDLDNSNALIESKAADIDDLSNQIDNAQQKITSLEGVVNEKDQHIMCLDQSLARAQKAIMAFASKQEEMHKSMMSQKDVLNSILVAHNTTAGHVGGIFVDMISLADDIGGAVNVKNEI